MPRLFIQLESASERHQDAVGQVFASDTAAFHEAARVVGSILTDDLTLGRSPVEIIVTVERDDGSQAGRIRATAEVERDQPTNSNSG